MAVYIARRIGWSVVVLFAIAIVTFFVTFILPADPARMIAGIRATPEDVDRIRHALGLDQPFLAQLGQYLGRLLSGDFGHSYIQNRDVLSLILERFPATLQLAAAGLLVELAIGLPARHLRGDPQGDLARSHLDPVHDRAGLGAVVPASATCCSTSSPSSHRSWPTSRSSRSVATSRSTCGTSPSRRSPSGSAAPPTTPG